MLVHCGVSNLLRKEVAGMWRHETISYDACSTFEIRGSRIVINTAKAHLGLCDLVWIGNIGRVILKQVQEAGNTGIEFVTNSQDLSTQFIMRCFVTNQNRVCDALQLPDHVFPTERIADIVDMRRCRICGRAPENGTPLDWPVVEVELLDQCDKCPEVPRIFTANDTEIHSYSNRCVQLDEDGTLDVFAAPQTGLLERLDKQVIVYRTQWFACSIVKYLERFGEKWSSTRYKNPRQIIFNVPNFTNDVVSWRRPIQIQRILNKW
ncbi:hypothetical protein D3C86_1497170 [compost metagenome]